ncbi:zinc finger protein 518B [Betta splendens]|uniref:Zinc finger protein 518B n=1 Tax=Betta splendens TaxID=158456 RepID=A0A6P7NRP5_BETSP|nr:zinc finger protein 518B [Betta splendens]XP_029020664.1 zinc finger protein 518B [Betta splendens]
MKPVSYQSMPPSVSGAHPGLALDRFINTSNVMYCEKCGFASTDAEAFKKHMIEHLGTRFYCFYCNGVSFSEAELNAHLKQHTKYPFKCPHCGQGYMRRLCLVKHIERLHNKSVSPIPTGPKAGVPKHLHVPVSSALSSVPVANLMPPPPAVRITVPKPSGPPFRLGKDEGKGKTLATNVSNASNRNADHLSPLNGLIQHNRALTVSLPEEVSIPAGCLVELVEVKTVNGTKELKLRLVTQQENESVIKDTRTTVSQSSALGKPLSSALNHPSSRSMGMCAPNRKLIETNSMDMERTAVSGTIPKKVPNQVNKEKAGFKRTSEVINLECNIPNKLPKCILSPVRDVNPGIRIAPRDPVTITAPAPAHASAVVTTRVTSRLTSSLHPDNMGSGNLIPELSKSIPPPRRASDPKSVPREVALPVKLEPGEVNVRSNAASEIKKETAGSNQQSLKSALPSLNVSSAADAQLRPPAVCKDNAAAPNLPFPSHRTASDHASVKTPALSNHTNSSIVSWPSEVRPRERARDEEKPEPESFPVISSVFSLSQQPEEVQGSFQPLVMALRGIVMEKTSLSGSPAQSHVNVTNSKEPTKEEPKAEYGTEVAPKSMAVTCDRLEEQTKDCMKVEAHEKGVQHPPLTDSVHIKEEVNNTKTTTSSTCSQTSASESSKAVESASESSKAVESASESSKAVESASESSKAVESASESSKAVESGSTKTSPADVPVAAAPLQPVAKRHRDVYSSKFPTVSLRRVQMGVWKRSSIGLKLRISKYKARLPVASVADCTVIHPMPLKVNQLVKRPGPYQPVVVLNHPKPRATVQGVRADSVADTGASTMVPKCQILKMRLSKVMGQKYEVMGCTVRVFQ